MAITLEKATALVKSFVMQRCVTSLYVLKSEEDALKAAGYDPNRCVCVKREDGSSVFVYYPQTIGPIILEKSERGSYKIRQNKVLDWRWSGIERHE